MSTVISNGYKLGRKMDLRELHEFTMALRNKMEQVAIHLLEERLAQMMTELIDTLYIKGLEGVKKQYQDERVFSTEWSLIRQAYWMIYDRNRKVEMTQERDPEYDFTCNLVLIPIPRKILVLFYAEQEEYVQAWREFEIVEEYDYYDNTDRPQTISKKQWDIRKRDWEQALPLGTIPALQGMTIECVVNVPSLSKVQEERIISHIPSLEKRAYKLASDIIFARKLEENKDKERGGSKGEKVFYVYNETFEWLHSDEGREEIKKEQDKIIKKLKPSISVEDIRKSLSQFNTSV